MHSSHTFTGRTRFDRLYLIGTTSTLLSTDVLKSAVAEAKSGKDVARYEKAVRALAEVAPAEPEATLDTAWVQEVQRSIRAQTDRLEHELRGYKNNLIKESIRVRCEFKLELAFRADPSLDGQRRPGQPLLRDR